MNTDLFSPFSVFGGLSTSPEALAVDYLAAQTSATEISGKLITEADEPLILDE